MSRSLLAKEGQGKVTVQQAVKRSAAAAKDTAAPANFDEVSSAVQNAAGKVLAGFKASEAASREAQDDWRKKVLWVDDLLSPCTEILDSDILTYP